MFVINTEIFSCTMLAIGAFMHVFNHWAVIFYAIQFCYKNKGNNFNFYGLNPF